MAILSVQRLLESAQSGEKLITEDRRRVVAWITATQPDVNNQDMANWFSCSEGTIRKDRMNIRLAMAKEIKEDDIGLVIGDILFDFKRQIRDIESSKLEAKKGSNVYLSHCQVAMDLRLKTVKALQELGYLPKNLGNMTVEKFEYAAIVSVDGSVETRPVNMFDEQTQKCLNPAQTVPVIEAEFEEVAHARTVKYENSAPRISSESITPSTDGEQNETSNTTPAQPTPEAT